MKRKLTALLLAAAMLVSMVPAVGAAETTAASSTASAPSDFYNQVGLELLPARSAGLYDEPDHAKPGASGSGFIRTVEGWTPAPVAAGVPVAVTDPEEGATEISTPQQLQDITAGGSYVLTADIDLSDTAWTPQSITGDLTLDGQGHTIKGLTLSLDTPGDGGLFARVSGALTVKNLRLDAPSITTAMTENGSYCLGVLAGYVAGQATLQNVAVSGATLTRTTAIAPPLAGSSARWWAPCP